MHDVIGGATEDSSWGTPDTAASMTAVEANRGPENQPGAFIGMVAPPSSLAGLVELIAMAVSPDDPAAQLSLAQLPDAGAQVVFAIEHGSSLPGGRPIGRGQRASLLVMPAHLRMTLLPTTVHQVVAASLHPPASRLVAPRGTGELAGSQLLPLQTLWGDAALDLLDQLVGEPSLRGRLVRLARTLEARLPLAAHPNPIARQATEMLVRARGGIGLSAVATSCRCTLRTLYAAVVAETGLRPKQLARIVRVRHAIDLLVAGNGLVEAAAQATFSDQAHMTREFRALLYQSPKFFARRLRAARDPDPSLAPLSRRPISHAGFWIDVRAPRPSPLDEGPARSRPSG